MNDTPESRAKALLQKMTTEEKIYQVTAQMIFDIDENYQAQRNPLFGSYRNPGHFMHQDRAVPRTPGEVTRQINADVKSSIEAQPHRIPPIENGEALHGAQWGMCTNFPQPIGLASSFDPEMVERVADVIGQECNAVGVRQVFSPVVNIVRDCRWGRTVETYGEDVKLSADMGAAMCRGLQKNGVTATPKHFADNYAAGGRDSNYSETSERTMREVFLPPFKACFDAGAKSVMAAYNAWEGVPCTSNERLLTEILRNEWGFDGFTVSDYSGVDGVYSAHRCAGSLEDAAAKSLKAGLDVILPYDRFQVVKEALEKNLLTEEDLDRNVLRILTAKFRLGLFEDPYRDPEEADRLVRNDRHRQLALESARECIVLLKNERILPLQKEKIKKIGVFGQSAKLIPIGSNYSGPYRAPWQGDDAPTPLEALKAFAGEEIEVIYGESDEIETIAPTCDINLYFSAIIEGEGSDRSDLRLPSITVHKNRNDEGGYIVDTAVQEITEDQETSIIRLCKANPNTVVILENGAPIDMTAWIGLTPAVIEAWYPGEQGAKALTEILFGVTNPSAKLPITIPKSVGQLPLYYAYKPSGRGYAYCDNDGKPLYPFGFGLSYTTFSVSNAHVELTDQSVLMTCDVANTGETDGAEVLQVYLGSYDCDVTRPVKELKAYTRVTLQPGEKKTVSIEVTKDALSYYDRYMDYGLFDGAHTLMLGTSSEHILTQFEITVRNGCLSQKQ